MFLLQLYQLKIYTFRKDEDGQESDKQYYFSNVEKKDSNLVLEEIYLISQ